MADPYAGPASSTSPGTGEYPKYGMVSRYFVYKQTLMEEAERLVEARVLREKEDILALHGFVWVAPEVTADAG